MIVELGDHDMREQSRSGLAALNRQGRYLARYCCIAVFTDHPLFNMPDNLHRCRYVLHHLYDLVRCLQEGCSATGRTIAGRWINSLFSWKTIRQWFALRLFGRVIQLR